MVHTWQISKPIFTLALDTDPVLKKNSIHMNHSNPKSYTVTGIIAALWGVTGLLTLLGFAVWRLGNNMLEAFKMPLDGAHWLVFVVFLIFMSYSEGYKGFQVKFSPRFAARMLYLSQSATPVLLVFAPLFCMGYFGATKKRVIATFALTAMIVVFILSFQLVPQPWRGLLDAGVVIGLFWGMVSTVLLCLKAFTEDRFHYDAELSDNLL